VEFGALYAVMALIIEMPELPAASSDSGWLLFTLLLTLEGHVFASVCLLVCLLQELWVSFREIFERGWHWGIEQSVRFLAGDARVVTSCVRSCLV